MACISVARLITPMLAAFFLKSEGQAEHGTGKWVDVYMGILNWALANRMNGELRKQQDPRMEGQGGVFDRYPYADPKSAHFYERYLKGEKLNHGWVSPSDFEKGPIED
jgi:hypothetical protein